MPLQIDNEAVLDDGLRRSAATQLYKTFIGISSTTCRSSRRCYQLPLLQ